MSIETLVTAARARVLSRVAAIVDDGREHARAVRRALTIESAGRGRDIDNALGDLIAAAMVARDEHSAAERPYYEMTLDVLTAARLELSRRSLELAQLRAAGGR